MQDRLGGRPVTPLDNERALRGGMNLMGATEKLDPLHLRHPLVGDHERDVFALRLQARELGERGAGRELWHDPVVVAIASSQRIAQLREGGGVVVDHEDDRSAGHVSHGSTATRDRVNAPTPPAVFLRSSTHQRHAALLVREPERPRRIRQRRPSRRRTDGTSGADRSAPLLGSRCSGCTSDLSTSTRGNQRRMVARGTRISVDPPDRHPSEGTVANESYVDYPLRTMAHLPASSRQHMLRPSLPLRYVGSQNTPSNPTW